jgi:hypothetical protein
MAQFLQENIYVHDGIFFFSKRKDLLAQPPQSSFVDVVIDPQLPIVVIEHGEAASQQYNEMEIALVTPLIDCALSMRLDGADGIGLVAPHRAQKALLRQHFPQLAEFSAIDTVERFQGGERDVIIVSATASDPAYVLAEADFLLNLNRLNVALSRPRKKLIVIASRSVTKLLVSDSGIFDFHSYISLKASLPVAALRLNSSNKTVAVQPCGEKFLRLSNPRISLQQHESLRYPPSEMLRLPF